MGVKLLCPMQRATTSSPTRHSQTHEAGAGEGDVNVATAMALIKPPVHGFFFFQAEDGIRDYVRYWSSDVCSSDLGQARPHPPGQIFRAGPELQVRDRLRPG